jgi:sporulation protein YlmC with PRC-barrel domain
MSKAKLIGLGVAVAALAATPAFAQTSSPSTTRPSTSAPSGAPSTRAAMPSDIKAMKASDLIGKNVYSANDERIGEVDDVVVSKSGNAPAAVIGVGGFLGIGEKKAAVPLDQLQVQGDKIVAAGLSKESLKAQADYKDGEYTKYDRNRTLGEAASGTTRTAPATGSGSTGMGSGSSTSPSGSTGMGGGTGSSPTSPSGSSSGSTTTN